MIPHGMMTEAEKAMLMENLGQSRSYLEWGMGNTTLWALSVSTVKRITAIEGCEPFLADWVRVQDGVAEAEQKKRLRVIFADTGMAAPHSEPSHNWAAIGEAYAAPKTLRNPSDFVLVDGRFRVACAITAALLGCGRVAIHDYSFRPHYGAMMEFFDLVEAVDTIIILKPKKKINLKNAEARRAQYFLDPR